MQNLLQKPAFDGFWNDTDFNNTELTPAFTQAVHESQYDCLPVLAMTGEDSLNFSHEIEIPYYQAQLESIITLASNPSEKDTGHSLQGSLALLIIAGVVFSAPKIKALIKSFNSTNANNPAASSAVDTARAFPAPIQKVQDVPLIEIKPSKQTVEIG